MKLAWLLGLGVLAIQPGAASWAQTPPGSPSTDAPTGPIPIEAPPTEKKWLSRWFNPATAPFIPVPEIAVDPDSGTTLGLIPTWIKTDENHSVSQIIAPDVLYNPYFGFGVHGRIYSYASPDAQWSIVAGIKERVERKFDGEYQVGRLRDTRWSVTYSLIYDRDGTPRFYGIGNNTRESAETNYTSQQDFGQVQVGFNIDHTWQLLYTVRLQVIDVLPGTLNDVASIQNRFPDVTGIGTDKLMLNRFAVVYDTRDDPTIPSKGQKLEIYGGAAAKHGLINASMYSEAGLDARGFWQVATDTVLSSHLAIRYLPSAHQVPFWALSNIGGGVSDIGGGQPLRGFGAGRFYDRDSFSTTLELRRKVFSINAVTTNLDIEIAPFIDMGRVFSRSGTDPFENMHRVYGVGFRGIARPFVVGYVDIGRGSEGAAVFTGLNYPF